MQWYRADLHLHTPASDDYHDKHASYIDILRRAEQRGIDIIALTDHNTAGGYAAMVREIELLEFLKESGRAVADELRLLAEYHRLLDKILVLPGFEFTAMFGFHILGIFPPDTPVNYLEHLLLNLHVPLDVLERGDSSVGASADVLTAYEVINQSGGIAIAAHVNTAHGVAMKGMDFGGQTRMAYTQDRNLHALEMTDLHRRGRGSTARFFDGTKPEYPRRMHCIQGSDAHSLDTYQEGKNTRQGVGERVTEMLLPERSFEALLNLFSSTDFARTRPYNPNRTPIDYILAAREEGDSIVQSFHESMEKRGGHLHRIVGDVCAFANTNGGTIYIGIGADTKKKPQGINNVGAAIEALQAEINNLLTPTLDVQIDAQETQGKTIIRILVPYGEDRPYAVNNDQIFVRDEAETTRAVRDEIVTLVEQGLIFRQTQSAQITSVEPQVPELQVTVQAPDEISPPRAGVEIVEVENRNGTEHYTMHDLRNGNIVKNVTRSSARKLWHYAIKQWESNPVHPDKVQWQGNIGLWRRYQKSGDTRYDFVQQTPDGLRVYYGVTEVGIHGPWEEFLAPEDRD